MSGGFEDLGLLHELVRATSTQGWLLPSDVQDESIPLILGGGDVLVAAETGSGKTGAFALPAIQIVHETRRAQAALTLDASSSSSATASGGSTSPPKNKKARHHSSDGFGNNTSNASSSNLIMLSVSDRSSMVSISEDGLSAQCRQEKDWGGVRGTVGVLKGSAYYEATMTDEGLCRLGWSTQAGSHNLGTDKFGFGFGGTGKKSTQGKFDDYGEPFKFGDVIGCCLQVNGGAGSGGSISWTKNGRQLGEAFSLQKGVGTLYPALCMKNAELKANFGATPFKFEPPTGYTGLALLPKECLVGGGAGIGGGGGGAGSGSPSGGGGGKRSGAVHPVCLILEPARDLALQTGKQVEELKRFVESPSIGCGVIIGGMSNSYVKEQVTAATDIVVACMQTLQTCIDKGEISLDQVRLLILDEADRFTERENLEMLDKLFKQIRSTIDSDAVPGRLQVCFFSATLHSPEITALAAKMCNRPTWVDLKGKDSVPETVHHVIVPVDPVHDRSWLTPPGKGTSIIEVQTDGVHEKDKISAGSGGGGGLSKEEKSEGLKRLKPKMLVGLIDSLKMTQCLIFCRTNVDCDNLEAYLTAVGGGNKWRAGAEKGKENAYSCCVLAGMRGQEERTRNLQAFKDGDVRFLICTDVAARGLDIKELPYVINMTLPDEPENYIHRIGRVGRADRMGLAISFVAAQGCDEKVWFHTCNNRGKGCVNTNLVQNMEKKTGGCCIWYDEPGKFKAVKKRLSLPEGTELPIMQVSTSKNNSASSSSSSSSSSQSPYVFALPREIADLGVEYGEEKGGKQETSDHVLSIASQVSALLSLEVQAQQAYLSIKTKWTSKK